MRVLVAGGSGFIGRSLCRMLDERGHRVTAASRSPDVAEFPDSIETAVVDVAYPDLSPVVDRHDIVVNLVALPSHVQPRGNGHEAVHLGGTQHLLSAGEKTGVDRFVQMSGLGVDTGVSTAYFRAKRRAERTVRQSDLDWVVYRPSVVVGDGCAIIPFLEKMTPPVIAPLPSGGAMRIQPIWVEDLAPMIADGVENTRHVDHVYEIGGPEKLTLAQTIELICGRRLVVPIPMPLAAVAFAMMGVVPGVRLGLDQYRALKLDNTVEANDAMVFGMPEDDLRTLEDYLAGK